VFKQWLKGVSEGKDQQTKQRLSGERSGEEPQHRRDKSGTYTM